MDTWLLDMIATFCVSLLLTGIIIPQILLIAFRKKLFDVPDERKIHRDVVPRLGGMAFMPAIFFSIACVMGFELLDTSSSDSLINSPVVAVQVCFIVCAMLMVFLCGLSDDLIGVRYRAKFVIQIISGMLLIVGGLWLCNLHGFLGIETMPRFCGYALTLLVIVFIVNAINLIDGIDGLASGLGAIAVLFYGIAFYLSGQYFYAVLSAATLGALVQFFYYNVFGDPSKRKKIFMGDTGSLTIGIVLAVLSIRMSMNGDLRHNSFNPIVVAFAPLIIPCFDVVRVYIHRLARHRNPFLPDKSHIHHKILALGIPSRMAMLIILIVSAVLITVNVLLSARVNVTFIVAGDGVIWVAINVIISKAIARRQSRLGIHCPLCD